MYAGLLVVLAHSTRSRGTYIMGGRATGMRRPMSHVGGRSYTASGRKQLLCQSRSWCSRQDVRVSSTLNELEHRRVCVGRITDDPIGGCTPETGAPRWRRCADSGPVPVPGVRCRIRFLPRPAGGEAEAGTTFNVLLINPHTHTHSLSPP